VNTNAAAEIGIDRSAVIDWYQRNRRRSRTIFDLIDPSAYYSRPIALRNPIVFYEGHLPAFSVIAFLKRGLGRPGVHARLEKLFERGIDPDSAEAAVPRSGADTMWPARAEVLGFGAAADAAILEALEHAPLIEDRPAMRRGQGLFTALEHEAMHQETLLYMWHRLPYEQKREVRPPDALPPSGGPWLPPSGGRMSRISIPDGVATLGADRDFAVFGWDNEFDAHRVRVPAFEIDVHSVTNGAYLEFMRNGGYRRRDLWSHADWAWREAEGVESPAFWMSRDGGWLWRGMFEAIPLPLDWPVYVSQAEAAAYAKWQGRRLPTEAEYHRAAFGTATGEERFYPWGNDPPDASRGRFDFRGWDPAPAGSHPRGASAWGVHDLVGNGWEWTSTVFGPFAGFEPMASYPEYSADFFDGQHFVMKGASPATASELLRPSFRNWFRSNYPYVYAKFRTVGS
jgi:ergothioneine biosynthesis protein EgtB